MTYDFNNDPLLQHPKLTPNEMAMICDVCNPGFSKHLYDSDEHKRAGLIGNVLDSFSIYPGTYEEKWNVDRDTMARKLDALSLEETVEICNQVDRFWESATSRAS